MSKEGPMEMACPYCGKPAEWVDNAERYGRRYGKSWMCWWCRGCDAYVGCHRNTRVPLGTMADANTRMWRTRAHAAIDPLWKGGHMSRSKMYDWLSERLGRDVHVGSSSAAECREIIGIAVELIKRKAR